MLELRAQQNSRASSFVYGVQREIEVSSWHICNTKDCGKQVRNEKVMGPQSRGGQKVQKKSQYEAIFQTPKTSLDFSFLPLAFKDDL
jgi:hypothetical protein